MVYVHKVVCIKFTCIRFMWVRFMVMHRKTQSERCLAADSGGPTQFHRGALSKKRRGSGLLGGERVMQQPPRATVSLECWQAELTMVLTQSKDFTCMQALCNKDQVHVDTGVGEPICSQRSLRSWARQHGIVRI